MIHSEHHNRLPVLAMRDADEVGANLLARARHLLKMLVGNEKY